MKTRSILFLLLLGVTIGRAQPPAAQGAVGQVRRAMPVANEKQRVCEKRALDWFQKNQNPDGSWGDSQKGAMTGFSLLVFLAHGETPEARDYGPTVSKAITWILENGAKSDGRLNMAAAFNQPSVYEHAICTYALCEYYTITRDGRAVALLKKALGYIVQGQGPGGGWMYSYDRTADDLSVSGWQIQALRSAQLSKLEIPGVDPAIKKAMKYLEAVKGPKGGYGYRGPQDKYSLTGAAIYCRLLGKAERGELRKGMEWLLDETEKDKPVKYQGDAADLYAWYYHTRACQFFGGAAWLKWNHWFRDEILGAQSPDGSWPIPGGRGLGLQNAPGKSGQVYRTAMCMLMLETFYRCLPTLQD